MEKGHFGQNGQKLHENYKINIFGSKQWGEGYEGNKPIFWVVPHSPSPPPLIAETLHYLQGVYRFFWKKFSWILPKKHKFSLTFLLTTYIFPWPFLEKQPFSTFFPDLRDFTMMQRNKKQDISFSFSNMYNALKTHHTTWFLYVFLVEKVIKTSIVFIKCGRSKFGQ